MPSIYELKPRFQNLLRPVCRALVRLGVTANQVTVAAALLSFLTAALIYFRAGERWTLLLLPGVLFVRMALNAIDGMLAREHDMKTPLGAILNELGDVLADAALYLSLVAVPGVPATPLVVTVLLSVVAEMTGVIAVQIGAARRYDGPMGKSDRAFVFGGVALLLGLGVPGGRWLSALFWAVAVLLVVTIVNRSRRALSGVAP